MNFYQRHLGDYAKDTKHLTMLEHGAYCLLLDYYYATEKPIPSDRCDRITNAYANDEREAVKSVLKEFFTETPEGWRHFKCDDVIEAAASKSLKAKESAKTRWMRTHSERIANAEETQCDGNAIHKPLTISHIKASPIVPSGDEAALLSAYHSILPKCKRVEVLHPKRSKRIAAISKLAKSVCASQGWPYVATNFWQAYFGECAKDPWMRGDVPYKDHPNWKQKLETLIGEDRFADVMDGAIASMRSAA